MPEVSYLREMINGVPVVATPAEIDTLTAEQLHAVLLAATGSRHPTVVVDMTRTASCDASGVQALLQGQQRAVAKSGELRLVIPAVGAVPRMVKLTCLHRFIPCFPSLTEALAGRPPPPVQHS